MPVLKTDGCVADWIEPRNFVLHKQNKGRFDERPLLGNITITFEVGRC